MTRACAGAAPPAPFPCEDPTGPRGPIVGGTADVLTWTPSYGSGMYVGLLGPLVLAVRGAPVSVPGRMNRAVLARLALADGRAVSASALSEMLWPDRRPDSARNSLQVKVSRLRSLLGDEADRIEYTNGTYRLRLGPDDTDIRRFERLLGQGCAAVEPARPDRAVGHLREAVGLWRGDPLAELADSPSVASARARFDELWWVARETHAEALVANRAAKQAVGPLRELLCEQPLRPRPRLLLMDALELTGRRSEALAVFDEGRRLFSETYGLEPPGELRAAFEVIALRRTTAGGAGRVTCRGGAPGQRRCRERDAELRTSGPSPREAALPCRGAQGRRARPGALHARRAFRPGTRRAPPQRPGRRAPRSDSSGGRGVRRSTDHARVQGCSRGPCQRSDGKPRPPSDKSQVDAKFARNAGRAAPAGELLVALVLVEGMRHVADVRDVVAALTVTDLRRTMTSGQPGEPQMMDRGSSPGRDRTAGPDVTAGGR